MKRLTYANVVETLTLSLLAVTASGASKQHRLIRRFALIVHAAAAPIGPFRQGGSRLRLLRLAFFCLAAVASLAVGAGPVAAAGTVTNYTGTGISEPFGIAAGPDGALWFANESNNSIGRITTSGVVSNYTGTGISGPHGIAAGPDGALWFTNPGNNSIGQITTGGVVSNYTGSGIHHSPGIAAGPDGALWFTQNDDEENGSIGRITTSGFVSSYTGTGISEPFGIVAGPVGEAPERGLWFTSGSSIGRITTKGVVSNYTGTGMSNINGIAAGSDGALWFTNFGNNSIGRITTSGVVSNYTGTGISGPYGIAAGPDGALWFTNRSNNSIGRITTNGVVSNYTGTGISVPYGIAAGPDGALWFTNSGNNSIGRITAFDLPHWQKNGTKTKEGEKVPTISWGTVMLEPSSGGTVTCKTASVGNIENTAIAAKDETELFATIGCKAVGDECVAKGGETRVGAPALPWLEELWEEGEGSELFREQNAGVQLNIECYKEGLLTEHALFKSGPVGAETGTFTPAFANGSTAARPSEAVFDASSGHLFLFPETGGLKLTTKGKIKIEAYEGTPVPTITLGPKGAS